MARINAIAPNIDLNLVTKGLQLTVAMLKWKILAHSAFASVIVSSVCTLILSAYALLNEDIVKSGKITLQVSKVT